MRTYLLGFTALTALCAGAAYAQTVERVVVEAPRLEETLPQELSRHGARLTTISGETIKNKVYDDATQALQFEVPGMHVTPFEGPFGYSYISFQGSRPSDVLFSVDGVRLNNRLYQNTLPLDTIPAHMIERIEVLEGGEALFYGTQAVAGIVNIVTRSFTDEPAGQLGAGYHTNNGYNINGYFSDAIGRSQFVVYGSSDWAEGYRPYRARDYQPSGTDRTRSYSVQTAGAKYQIEASPSFRLSATYQHTNAKLDISRAARLAKSFNEKKEDIASAKIDWRLAENLDLFVKGYYHNWDAFVTEFANSITGPARIINNGVKVPWGFEDYGANALARLKTGHGVDYYAGYDLQIYSGFDDFYFTRPTSERTHAVFAQLRTNDDFSDRFRASAGLRYNKPSAGPSSTVWNVTARYDILDNLFAQTNFGTAFRLPSASELFVNYSEPGYNEIGNPNLKPETSTNINASIGGRFASLNWEIIGFYRDIKDLTNLIDDGTGTDTFVWVNTAAKVEMRGFEIVVGAALGSDLYGSASYTRTDAHAANSTVQLQRIPESGGQASLDWAPKHLPFGGGFSLNYVGEVHYTQAATNVSYGDYAVMDLFGRYYLDQDRKHRFKVRLENVFDQEYGQPRSTPRDTGGTFPALQLGAPRTLHIGYDFTF